MFNNWINIHDLRRFREKITAGDWRQWAKKASSSAQGRTRAAWEHTENPPIHAWEIPALCRRWNQMISGDENINQAEYVCRKFLYGKNNLTAFSPGCGGGGNEMRWAATGLFEHIDAIDLSAPRIAAAKAEAEHGKLAGILNFQVNDMALVSGESIYDLVIADGALHHFYPMHTTLEMLRRLLKPGGLLVVNDFVGPSRFQWTARQLQTANAFLALIPEAYRRRWGNGRVKERIDAPGRLRMRLSDPSEAAESSRIRPLLNQMFTTLEVKEKGGALVPLVFFDIAHHYLQPDAAAQEILRLSFAVEDLLMQNGKIASDYICGVFQKPPS